MRSSIRKMLTAAGGPMKKIKTRDINGNWVYMDISTGRTTSAGPETGTIRTNTVNSVGGDVKTKQGRTKIALKQATSYNNRLYKVHNYADTTMRLKLKHQDVVLDKQGEPKIVLTDYTPALEAPMLIVSPEFDVLTLGRQAATSIYKAAKPTSDVSSEIYYHGSPTLGLTTLEPQNGLLWLTDSKSGATLYGGGITGRGSLYKINNIDLGDNILTVNGKFHSPFKVPLKDLPEDVLKYLPKDKHAYIDRIADAARLAGYSSVLFKNVLDFGGKGASINPFHSYMYKQTAIFNPVNITSESVSPISRLLKFKQGGKMNTTLFLKLIHKKGGKLLKAQGGTKFKTTGGAGYVPPTININTEKIKNKIRRNLYDNLYTHSYQSLSDAVLGALGIKSSAIDRIIENQEELMDSNGNYIDFDDYEEPMNDAIWATYLSIPKNQRRKKSGDLKISKYTPSVGKENNIVYYEFPVSESDKGSIIERGISLPIGKNKIINMDELSASISNIGDYTIGHGYDNKGEYVSVYDKWDLNPFKGAYRKKGLIGNVGNKLFGKKGDLSFGIGKPVNLYNRIYLDDYYKVPDSYRGGTYLPEVVVYPSQELYKRK